MKNLETIANASIGLKNFRGAPTPYKPEGGVRTFAIFLDDDIANEYAEKHNWKIKETRPDADGNISKFIMVTVKWTQTRDPKVFLVNSIGKRRILEDEIGTLDNYQLKDIDVVLDDYEYDFNGHIGHKPMLEKMFATIVEDEFDRKYADVPYIDDAPFNG